MGPGPEIVAAYKVLKTAGRLREILVAEYRCRHGCLLAHVFQLPGGRCIYVPVYKLSRERNLRDTVESARRKSTIDGDRRWRERGFDMEDLITWQGSAQVDVHCDHHQGVLNPLLMDKDLAGVQPGHPRRGVLPLRQQDFHVT